MNAPLDELYLAWLYSQIGSVKTKDPSKTYWSLAKQLYTKEFVWIVPNDDNRAEDGRDLRYEFLEDHQIDIADQEWLNLGCSMLEMLIGVARRLSFEDDRPARGWFWRMMDNLELEECTDQGYNRVCAREVDQVLDQIIWRTYHHDGRGGLFPLEHPTKDQREIEIWYQLNAYLMELE